MQRLTAGVFYQAYYDLEVVNQEIYKRNAISLNFDYKANWFTRFRGHAAGLATHLVTFRPESLIKVIVPYIHKPSQNLGALRPTFLLGNLTGLQLSLLLSHYMIKELLVLRVGKIP